MSIFSSKSNKEKVSIERVEIYFEPLGAIQDLIEVGAQVGIPLDQGIPAAISTADQYLSMNGQLIDFASQIKREVQLIDEKSDAEWASFLNAKAEGMRWKRWNGETSQGRWNVIVYLGSDK